MSIPKLIAAGLLALLFAAPGAAQDGKTAKGTITTTGSATVEVKPDTVRITFGNQVRLSGLKEARADGERQAKKLSDALKALKLENLKIAATTSSVQVTLSANAGGAPGLADVPLAPSAYQLTTTFTVTAKANDIEKLRNIAKRVGDAALDNGANVPGDGMAYGGGGIFLGGGGGGFPGGMQPSRVFAPGVEIFREDTTDAQTKALAAAVKNAVVKAEALAMGASTKNLKIIAITDEAIAPDGPGVRGPAGRGIAGLIMAGYDPTPPMTATSLTVRVRVTCSFE